ncbi:2OG-Fe(II) oxygenase [Amylibacter sp. IMCC11727]|uniref:HalD/BesD family halogenase n=1 Tax=Amylibacter sp. IMCC11727 TaxID=3039851 RepID=UPI00244DC6FF|nr:2OG-Fe(II) oxygenase [Amylibacter sp. IMCC11727]WGI22391.1 2OG-Fe(II) oxygenase [Amylibacter sp. IMCC11727]
MKDILDLSRFPIDQTGSAPWHDLVARCRADLAAEGMFNLDGLLRREVAEKTAADLMPKFDSESFSHVRQHNIYFKKSIPELDDDHPALVMRETSNRTLCADQLGQGALMRLYEWEPFIVFLAACMEKPVLHTMGDPLARVNVMAYTDGQALNWHFDRSEFTTTLLLQAPDQGGAFEYCSDLRRDDDPNYDGVARLLRGAEPTKQIDLSAGTLNVFAGKNTAHRVTPVIGNTPRMIAVFSYYETPDVMFSEEERLGFYGRV